MKLPDTATPELGKAKVKIKGDGRMGANPPPPGFSRFHLRRGRLAGTVVQRVRVFDLQIALPPYNEVALDVLNSLETDRLMVFDENERGALESALGAGREIDLSRPATKEASIRRWLAAGCQVIRWDVGDEIEEKLRQRGVMAMYRTNAAQVMYPPGVGHLPFGPAAFMGEIIVNADCFPMGDSEITTKRLQFVLAHELTHVFDMMQLLIPALKDWRKFWRNVLEDGAACEKACMFRSRQGTFVDHYGSEDELAMVKEYWPTKAQDWFVALRVRSDR